MKTIFKSLAIAAAALLTLSCVKEAPLASSVSADKATLPEFAAKSAAQATFNVSADGDWYIVAPAWLEATPSHGSGNAAITVKASDNANSYGELLAPKKGVISVCGETAKFDIAVTQAGEAGLDAMRDYSVVKDVANIDLGKKYLIAATTDGGENYLAMTSFTQGSKGDDSYDYIKVDKFPAAEGVISTEASTSSYSLTAKEGGYAVMQPNGFYLWQNGDSYTNFYSTKDLSKANTFTIAIDQNGLATIKSNHDKFLQYNPEKNYFECAATLKDGNVLPSLFIDSKADSGETLAAEGKNITCSTTEITIPVSANKNWTVRNHDDFIESFTVSGNGDGSLVVKFKNANTDKKSDRSATFQIIGESKYVNVTVCQRHILQGLAEVAACILDGDSAYEMQVVEGDKVIVSATPDAKNAFLEDKTGGMLYYKNNHGLEAGEYFTGTLKGSTSLYSGLPEITSIEGTKTGDKTNVPCTEVSLKKLNAKFDSYISRRILLKGVTFTKGIVLNTVSGEIEQDGVKVQAYGKVKTLTIPTGSVVDIIVYPGVNNKNNQCTVWAQSDVIAFTKTGGLITVPATLAATLGDAPKALEASVNSGAALSFASDKEDVVSVDATTGVMTFKAVGTAKIKVTAPAKDNYTAAEATCEVTVNEPSSNVVIVMKEIPDYAAAGTGNVVAGTQTVGDITLAFDKNGGNNDPKYYGTASYEAVRMYAKNKVTVTSASKNISKVVITYVDDYCGNTSTMTVTSGSLATDTQAKTITVSGVAAKSTTLVNDHTATSGGTQLRISKIEVAF